MRATIKSTKDLNKFAKNKSIRQYFKNLKNENENENNKIHISKSPYSSSKFITKKINLSSKFITNKIKEKEANEIKINDIYIKDEDNEEKKEAKEEKKQRQYKKRETNKIIVIDKDEEKENDKNEEIDKDNYKNKYKKKDKEKKENQQNDFQEKKLKKLVNALPEGRIKKIASYTQAGKDENGKSKVNQDSFLVLQNLYNIKDFNIFTVFDGHGVNGHLISQYVTKYFESFFKNNTNLNTIKNEDEIYSILKKNNYDIIKKAFQEAEDELENKTKIDGNFSGTTCVMVIQIGEKIICANVGDSRAILVKENYKVNRIIPLSIDQKPEIPEETRRIIKSGGEVSQLVVDGEKNGPYRVWKKGEAYPGLAMSRSIGDFIATSVGVIPVPKIIEETIGNNTKFIVIATDGIWEFLDNKKVVDMISPFYEKNDPDGACKELIKESTKLWKDEEIIVDDIAIIVIFF